jgi:hypothetical protein
MTTLHVPLHLPAKQAEAFLYRELSHREVLSTKVDHETNCLVVEHERKSYEPPQSIGF